MMILTDAELVNASRKKMVTIADRTHFRFLDRPERGRDRFVQEVLLFLGKPFYQWLNWNARRSQTGGGGYDRDSSVDRPNCHPAAGLNKVASRDGMVSG